MQVLGESKGLRQLLLRPIIIITPVLQYFTDDLC